VRRGEAPEGHWLSAVLLDANLESLVDGVGLADRALADVLPIHENVCARRVGLDGELLCPPIQTEFQSLWGIDGFLGVLAAWRLGVVGLVRSVLRRPAR